MEENKDFKVEKIDDKYKITAKITKESVEVWLKDSLMNMDLKPYINFNTFTKMIEISFNIDQKICYDEENKNKINIKNIEGNGLKYNI